MAVGEYEIGTSKKEFMTITSGKILVKLPASDDFKEFKQNETFIVEANQKFNVNIQEETAYNCLYK